MYLYLKENTAVKRKIQIFLIKKTGKKPTAQFFKFAPAGLTLIGIDWRRNLLSDLYFFII